MLTIEEYIAQEKKKNKLDEFDFSKHTENMSSVMQYVMAYFNDYLDMEKYDEENVKLERTLLKLEAEIEDRYPQSKNYILNFYRRQRRRIHTLLKNCMKSYSYSDLFFNDDDFNMVIDDYIKESKAPQLEEDRGALLILLREIKSDATSRLHFSEYGDLDNSLIKWIKETLKQYNVNLLDFAEGIASMYYDRYIKHEYDRQYQESYIVNTYNHRYHENPFDIDEIYEENADRPFLLNKKGELEILLMHSWVSWAHDEEYWSEYINLCISTGRVSMVQNVNALIAVYNNIEYPDDITCSTNYYETSPALQNIVPKGSYILRIDSSESGDPIWQDHKAMDNLIISLHKLFKDYSPPKVIEFSSPVKTFSFDEEAFFNNYSLLEKQMARYSKLKLVIVNGAKKQKKNLPSYICTIDDITLLRAAIKERKLHLRFGIDFSNLIQTDPTKDLKKFTGQLQEMRNMILCIHMTNVHNAIHVHDIKYRKGEDDLQIRYRNDLRYTSNDGFYSMLNALFSDNVTRYFIPKKVKNTFELEELTDNLLRSGFSFV